MNKENFMHTLIGIIMLIIPSYFYWCYADGIHAIKNMKFEEIIDNHPIGKKVLQTWSIPEIDLEDAVKKIDLIDYKWNSFKPESNINELKNARIVTLTIFLKESMKGKVNQIQYRFWVKKKWFFHFNPSSLGPQAIVFINSDNEVDKCILANIDPEILFIELAKLYRGIR